MLLQLEREFLQADLARVRALLDESPADEDPIEHFQFTHRATELEARLAALPAAIDAAPAAVALFFGGLPVVGSQGIKAVFGTKALGYFQKLVSQRFAANEQGPLASRGRVPLAEDTQLLLTDVVRGSFGFVLEAAAGQGEARTSLKVVVDEVADTLSRVAAPDDALFDEASAIVDDRQLGTLKEFFKLLDDEGASLRLVEGERDFELDRTAVARARHRVEGLSIHDRIENRAGEVVGWTQVSRRFEVWPHEGGPALIGTVAPDAMDRAISEGLNPLHRHFRLLLKVREVKARNRSPKVAYTLQGMEPITAPESWPSGVQQAL
ncbi:MAG: hypothetical protein K8R60_18860 [Burkholderiales bacterium]|nr:hypothetical protein [Burkholderiales bacterium]